MKLVRLRVRGLRSFRREVDIDLARLGEEGLFAIFGPTGAGKSTILDGIFLALFAECPRGQPADCVSTGEKELEIRLEVAIDEGEGPKAIAIERKFRWSRPPSEGVDARKTSKHAPLRLEVRDAEGWAPLDLQGRKAEEVLRARIVRVSATDFQQAVVLPQGQFDALLRAAPSERRRLVASLFRTEHLGEPLHALVRSREEALRVEIGKLDQAAREVAVTDEEVSNAGVVAESSRRSADEAARALELAEREATTARAARAKCAARDAAKRALDEIGATLAVRTNDRARVESGRRAATAASAIDELDRAEAIAHTASVGVATANATAREASERLNVAVHASLSAKGERETKEPALLDRLARAKLAAAATADLAALEADLEERARALGRTEIALAEKREAARLISARSEAAARNEATLTSELEGARVGEHERDEIAFAVAFAEARVARDRIERARESAKAEAEWAVAIAAAAVGEVEEDERAAAEAAEAARAAVATAEVDVRRANDATAIAERELDDARDRAAASTLAERLRHGDACPVCGAREHPGANHGLGQLAVSIAERAVGDARRARELADRARDVTVAERATREEELRAKGVELEERMIAFEAAAAKAKRIASGDEIPAAVLEALDEAARLEDVEALRSDALDDVARARVTKRAGEIDLAALRREEVALGRRARAAETLAKKVNEARLSATEARAEAEALAAAVASAQAERSVAAEARSLAEAALGTKRDEVGALVDSLAPGATPARSRKRKGEQLAFTVESSRDRVAPEVWIQRIEAALAKLVAEERATQVAADRARGDEARAALAAREAGARANEAKAALERANVLARAAIAASGFASIEAVRLARLDPATLARLATELDALEAERGRRAIVLAERAADVIEERSEAEATASETARDEARATAAQERERAAAASVQRDELGRRHARHLELRARIDGFAPRAERLAKIRDLVKGNQLSELAAERHLEAVTSRAAALLSTLSKDRYGLVRAANGSFAITDGNHGGVVRSPATLSGGETFLVSLALALALSERIQLAGRTRFDFFFLDEGFGSLDAATLEIAIAALESLRGPSRVIGMISHVGALEERMPRRLRVTPSRGGSASVVVEA